VAAPDYIYAVLRSPDDWASIVAHEPRLWSYDKPGLLKVEPEILAERAAPNVWTSEGWDAPPRTYPALAVRVLNPPEDRPRREEPASPSAPAPRPKRKYRTLGTIRRQYRLPPDTPEQLECLAEVYRLDVSKVVARIVAEAYRRDVVESGMLAILAAGDDLTSQL
jgi:hypothetical protein